MLAKDFSLIVSEVLSQVGETNPDVAKLIKGTFAAQSNLEEIVDHDNKCYGLCMISSKDLRHFVDSDVRSREKFRINFERTTGVSVSAPDDVLLFKLKTDLAFQILLVYAIYRNRFESKPTADLNELATMYAGIWKGWEDPTDRDLFINAYTEKFINSE